MGHDRFRSAVLSSRDRTNVMPDSRRLAFLLLAGLLLMGGSISVTRAETVSTLRIMLHPDQASPGSLSAAQHARLETLAGTGMTLVSSTRTGALELAFAEPREMADVARMVKRLREDRSVLWAEPVPASGVTAGNRTAASTATGSKLLVRLLDGVAPDWQVLLPRFTEAIGVPVAAERAIGNVWVLRLAQKQTADKLGEMASRLQSDAAVRYADPVLRRYARTVPNNPYYADQWALSDPLSGVNAPAAWSVQTGSAAITVAVVDTGILPHPDLAGRVLPGYDFITDAQRARDGDGRDPNPKDEGDWTDAGECGFDASESTWHGTFVSGLIAANTSSGSGIAGMDWKAKILPVRVLGACGGTDDDVFEGVLWASGVAIAGVPANPNPAKVINLSLGGPGSCAQSIQEAIDDALAQGAVVVVSAGNQTEDVTGHAPANCSGVITVGAHNRQGERTFYSNFGSRVDISAPGGEGDFHSWILSTSNDGTTVAGNPGYAYAIGTSFSAPYVSGTASLMLARNPMLTPGRVLSILQGTVRPFATASSCRSGTLCGIGMLDAGIAVASTVPGSTNPPPDAVVVIEYYNPALDHYLITASPDEIAYLDAYVSDTFQRTGYYFYAYADPASAPADARPVCRFYGSAEQLIASHYFTADPAECQFVIANWPGTWFLETTAAFYIEVPDTLGNCRAGTTPVYRFFNNRNDANQRHTVDLSVRRAMINRSWVPDGSGANGSVFCSPI